MKSNLLCIAFLAFFTIQAQEASKKPVKKPTPTVAKPAVVEEGIFATISTNKGDITLKLEYSKAPVTVANFISLAEGKNSLVTDPNLKAKPFYDGLKFHRVIDNFMIQTGDPTGTGAGGTGYSFKDEFLADLKFDKGGILAMANSGPATNASQFFITHKDTPWLNGKHTIFGHVTAGMNVVNNITQGDVMTKVTIVRKGALAKKFDAAKVFSDYYNDKEGDAKKQAALAEEAAKNEKAKYAPVIAKKLAYFAAMKAAATTTASGLTYKIVKTGTGIKPVDGATFYFHYAGYFEDGTLFDSSFEDVCKEYGTYDPNRAMQNGYNPFPFQAGKKDGMIPGFIEGLSLINYGDKAILFLPPALGYGERGAGGVIPPNANLIFEIEMFEKIPTK